MEIKSAKAYVIKVHAFYLRKWFSDNTKEFDKKKILTRYFSLYVGFGSKNNLDDKYQQLKLILNKIHVNLWCQIKFYKDLITLI